jgi:hypothetical protein
MKPEVTHRVGLPGHEVVSEELDVSIFRVTELRPNKIIIYLDVKFLNVVHIQTNIRRQGLPRSLKVWAIYQFGTHNLLLVTLLSRIRWLLNNTDVLVVIQSGVLVVKAYLPACSRVLAN